jgi:diguanylate cyclase (GGDEF)-like protein
MSEAPTGFALETYQQIVSDAAGEPVELAVCDDRRILMPRADELREDCRTRIEAYLADPHAPSGCREVPMDRPDGDRIRLVEVPRAGDSSGRGERSGMLMAALSNVCRCASHVWSLSVELDEMTDELTGRYEELNLLYTLDRSMNDDQGAAGLDAIRGLLEGTASHLEVSALGVFSPDAGMDLLVEFDGEDPGASHGQALRKASEDLYLLTRTYERALVLNRKDDPRRTPLLRDVARKFVAAPLGGGGTDGLVVGLRSGQAPDFTSSDRKLVAALADQIASFVSSSRDALTGLLNREGFERRLSAQFEPDGQRDGLLLHLDVHNFRVLNETCGRMAGDELLRQVAEILVHVTRSSDLVARLGNDEFAVFIQECTADDAPALADKVLQRLHDHSFVWAGKPQLFMVSVGVVPLVRVSGDVAHMLSVAESTCELAQATGANAWRLFSPEDEQIFERRGQVQWVPRIREALMEERFELFTQIIEPLDSRGGRLPHQEILLRLRDEEGELVPPIRFIPAAERFQLMPDLDRWVVTTTLTTLSDPEWLERAQAVVWSINLSGQSLSDERFHDFLTEAVAGCDFPAANLCFEITETAAVENHRAAVALIGRLKAAGITFALDDFGAGLSSFAYLKNLPVDLLKIDGSFVKGLASDSFSRATVAAVIQVGRTMGLDTMAEYVEDEAICQVCRELGVTYGQGYGIGRPQPLLDTLTELEDPSLWTSGVIRLPLRGARSSA